MNTKFISVIPLFLVVALIYVVMAYAGVDLKFSADPIFEMKLPSGEYWKPTWSGLIIMLGVIALYFEIVKSTTTGTTTIIEHGLSMVVFITCLMLYLLLPITGTSTFLIITLMSLLDVVAGFNITIASARRDFTMGG